MVSSASTPVSASKDAGFCWAPSLRPNVTLAVVCPRSEQIWKGKETVASQSVTRSLQELRSRIGEGSSSLTASSLVLARRALSPRAKQTSARSTTHRSADRHVPYVPNPPESPPPRPPPDQPGREPDAGQYDWNAMFLYSLLGVNALVYAGWQYAQNEWDQRKDPRSLLWMTENFLCGEINMSQGRPWTLITACVSHSSFSHFAINMVSLAFMSPPIIRLVGRKAFLGLYFGAGLISSGISIGWKKYIDPTFGMLPRDSSGNAISTGIYSHGASGSIYAVMTTFACLQPRATFLLFFFIPAPAYIVVPGILAYDFYSALVRPGQPGLFLPGIVDSAGHLGGAGAGVLFWRFYLRGLRFR